MNLEGKLRVFAERLKGRASPTKNTSLPILTPPPPPDPKWSHWPSRQGEDSMPRIGKALTFGIPVTCLLALAAVGLAPRRAEALTEVRLSLEELVAYSEQIVVAVCDRRESEFRGGLIVTTYGFRTTEIWKGSMKTDQSGVFEIDSLGGSVEAGPIALGSVVPGTSPILPGEEVLLFTSAVPQPEPGAATATGGAPAIRPGTYYPTSLSQGRYSVLTHPDSGEKFVVQTSRASDMGLQGPEGVRNYLNTMQQRLRTSEASFQTLDAMRQAVAAEVRGAD